MNSPYPQGQNPYAAPQFGQQPQYGQPYGQPGHGHPQQVPPHHGQPQYAQPQPGQAQHGRHPYAQPAYGQALPGAQGQGVAITTQFFPLMWILFFIKPKIVVDGHELPAAVWGRNEIPLTPGQHHLHVFVPYFLPPKIGKADLPILVQPNQPVELQYRAPLWAFSGGSLGPGPQPYKGLGAMIGITAIIFLFAMLLVLLPLLAA
ncbi:hypothetical protein [Gordonia sp. NPDC003376]